MNQREIAKLAGVSCATISRVINNDPKVTPKTAERVWKVIAETGYVQNSIARSLRMSTTKTIGFLVPDIANPFFPAVLRGIEGVCAEHGYNLILQNTAENPQREIASVDTLSQSRVDGVLAIVVDEQGEQLKKLRAMKVPVVIIDRRTYKGDYDFVTVDNVGGMYKGFQYLAGLGHHKIALIHGVKTVTPGIERLEGYLKAMELLGLPVNEQYVVDGKFTEEGGYQQVRELMKLPDPPTAIVTCNNMLTMGAFRSLIDLRCDIPGEISLLGFDDFPLAGYLSPPITVINRPTTEMGQIATKMVLEQIRDGIKDSVREIVLPCSLRIRSSCGRPK